MLLKAESLTGGYGRTQLLWDVCLEVREGQIVALLGPNGSGKSTLMRTIVGLNLPWSGRLTFAGDNLTSIACHERVRRGLGMVPPGRRLFLGLSVEDNLRMGGYLFEDSARLGQSLELAYEYFPALRRYRRRLAGRLSGGEQQMCAIARGLMSEPKLLMVDELSLGLAPAVVSELLKTLDRLRREQRITIVLVEQDVRTALAVADYAFILSEGRVALQGRACSVQGDQRLPDILMGKGRPEVKQVDAVAMEPDSVTPERASREEMQ